MNEKTEEITRIVFQSAMKEFQELGRIASRIHVLSGSNLFEFNHSPDDQGKEAAARFVSTVPNPDAVILCTAAWVLDGTDPRAKADLEKSTKGLLKVSQSKFKKSVFIIQVEVPGAFYLKMLPESKDSMKEQIFLKDFTKSTPDQVHGRMVNFLPVNKAANARSQMH